MKTLLDNHEQTKAILNDALSGPVEALLVGASNATWAEIRNLLWRETESAVSWLSGALSGFEMDEQTRGKMLADLEDYARGVVEAKAWEEAKRVLMRMNDMWRLLAIFESELFYLIKNCFTLYLMRIDSEIAYRFATLFSRDSDSMPRVWTRKENIRAIIKTACSSSLKLLSVMAAIRLDDDADNMENTLSTALVESGNNTVTSKSTTSVDPLATSTWEEVPSSKTLITPVRCKSLWRQFKIETGYTIAQAIAAQADNREIWTMFDPTMLSILIFVLGFHYYHSMFKNRI